MLWWITLGGFFLGCVVAYAMVKHGEEPQDKD